MSDSLLFVYDNTFKGEYRDYLCKSYKSYPKTIKCLTKEFLGVSTELPSRDNLRAIQCLVDGSKEYVCERLVFHLICQDVFVLNSSREIQSFINLLNLFVSKYKSTISDESREFIDSFCFNLGKAVGYSEANATRVCFSVKCITSTDECEDWYSDGIPRDKDVCNILHFDKDEDLVIESNTDYFKKVGLASEVVKNDEPFSVTEVTPVDDTEDCEYCDSTKVKYLADDLFSRCRLKYLCQEDLSKIWVLSVNDEVYRKVDYCPMCGRKLND